MQDIHSSRRERKCQLVNLINSSLHKRHDCKPPGKQDFTFPRLKARDMFCGERYPGRRWRRWAGRHPATVSGTKGGVLLPHAASCTLKAPQWRAQPINALGAPNQLSLQLEPSWEVIQFNMNTKVS